mgnify:CR=1 FL=1
MPINCSSNQFADQFPSFLLLTIVTFGDHFIEDVTGTLGIAHIDVGARQVQLCLLYTSPSPRDS